jgi:hypothetical protein
MNGAVIGRMHRGQALIPEAGSSRSVAVVGSPGKVVRS